MQKFLIPLLSALAGATLALSLSQAFADKKNETSNKATSSRALPQSQDQLIRQLFEQQREMESDFDTFFNDDFFSGEDPFETMRKFRQKMHQQFKDLNQGHDTQSPFDSWFSHRFGGGTIEDIKQREDDRFIYYEINVDDIETTTLNTRVENGMITIEGESKKKFRGEEPGQSQQSFMSSRFTRSFPLPAQVDADNMETERDGHTIIFKFPKRTL